MSEESQIALYSTLTRRLEPLVPNASGEVGIYACGPTVYAPIHIGNARPFVVFMVLKRFLERMAGVRVRLVMNLTDVNDKIYEAAREAGKPSTELGAEMGRRYIEDTDRLGLGRPDVEPTVTGSIDRIVALIESLVDAGIAYESDGDVYFSVGDYPDYGALSGQRPDQMDPSADAGRKRSPLDFALWKANKPNEDTSWPSPWGDGRPGWHIECSAMAEGELGCGFEVHGGGLDLVFPHHENEIAQTQAAGCEQMARIWMHNAMLELSGDKMSKSLGNIAPLAEVLDRWPAEVVVAYFLTSHYRSPIPFSDERMGDARAACERIANAVRSIDRTLAADVDRDSRDTDLARATVAARERFFDALADDFGTPGAFAAVFDLVSAVNAALGQRVVGGRQLEELRAQLYSLLDVLGLGALADAGDEDDETPDGVRELLERRERARSEKDFARADELRGEIAELGFEVVDTADGPHVYRSSDS
jgi:cysteinyl-tRNA synthetase